MWLFQFQRLQNQREDAVVVLQTAAVASVGEMVITAISSAHRIDEDGRTFLREEIVVAIGGIAARLHLRYQMLLIVDTHQIVVKSLCVFPIAIHHRKPFITSTKHIQIQHQFHLVEIDKRIFNKITRTS